VSHIIYRDSTFRQFCAVLRRSSERDRPSASSGTSAAAAEAAAAVAASSAAIVVSQASERHTTTSAGSGSAASGTSSTASGTSAAVESGTSRDVFRWRDRPYYSGPKRWLESALRDSSWQDKEDSNDAKKSASGSGNDANQSPLWLGDDLEFWPDKSGAKEKIRFVKIAAMSTELVAVSEKGILYQWRWSDMTPHRHDNPNGNHPRSSGLGLTNEKVVKISASNIRYCFFT
jgi:hypothetical protein